MLCFFCPNRQSITDQPSNLVLDLDGRRIEDLASYRQFTTECFDMGALAEPQVSDFSVRRQRLLRHAAPLEPRETHTQFWRHVARDVQAGGYLYVVCGVKQPNPDVKRSIEQQRCSVPVVPRTPAFAYAERWAVN